MLKYLDENNLSQEVLLASQVESVAIEAYAVIMLTIYLVCALCINVCVSVCIYVCMCASLCVYRFTWVCRLVEYLQVSSVFYLI